jgi:hypothetical protein
LNAKQVGRVETRRLAPNSTSKINSLEAGGESDEDDQNAFNIISQLLRVTQDTGGRPFTNLRLSLWKVNLQVALFDTRADKDTTSAPDVLKIIGWKNF